MRKSVLVFIAASLLAASVSAADASREIRQSLDSGAIRRLIVEMPASELTIRTAPARRIELVGQVAHEYKRDREAARAQRIVEGADIEIVLRGQTAILRPRYEREANSRAGKSDRTRFRLQLTVPPQTDVQIKQREGQVVLDGHFGHIDVGMTAGEIRIAVPKRSVKELIARTTVGEVRTNLGDRIVEKEGLFAGKVHFLNEGGEAVLNARLRFGEIDVVLR